MPRFVLGSTSSFPQSVDAWGEAKTNNVCEVLTASQWNRISDSVNQLERVTRGVMQVGRVGVLTPAVTGSLRPKMLIKTFDVEATGSVTWSKTFAMPAFTSAEKTLFGGSPLASGNVIILQARWRFPKTNNPRMAYRASLVGPIADPSGDSGWSVVLTPLGNDEGDRAIANGFYVISLLITNN